MNKPSPMPWTVEIMPGVHTTAVTVDDADGEMVCECYEGRLEQRIANARLIATAPDLLRVAKDFVSWFECERIGDKPIAELQAAIVVIAKANGEKL